MRGVDEIACHLILVGQSLEGKDETSLRVDNLV